MSDEEFDVNENDDNDNVDREDVEIGMDYKTAQDLRVAQTPVQIIAAKMKLILEDPEFGKFLPELKAVVIDICSDIDSVEFFNYKALLTAGLFVYGPAKKELTNANLNTFFESVDMKEKKKTVKATKSRKHEQQLKEAEGVGTFDRPDVLKYIRFLKSYKK